ncbi:MAG: RIP metalloprotease RseP, partial [bacterium]
MWFILLEYLRIALEVVIAFGLVIFFHEFGHFIMAKLAGVSVPEFALGMGPEITGITVGDTRYKLCIFPIGGYVKIIGEDEAPPEGLPPQKSLNNKSTGQKVSVIAAGPVMNYFLGILFFASVYIFWGLPREVDVDRLSDSVVVNFVDVRKAAAKADLKSGDVILAVDGIKVKGTEHFSELIGARADREVVIDLLRGGRKLKAQVTPRLDDVTKKGRIGVVIRPPMPREIKEITVGSPGWTAGLRRGDVILDFNGAEYDGTRYEFNGSVNLLKYDKKTGGVREVKVAAPARGTTDLGAEFYPPMEKIGIGRSLMYGAEDSVRVVYLVAFTIYKLIRKEVSMEDVAGPVGIIQYASNFARSGLRELINFFGLISVNLAV